MSSVADLTPETVVRQLATPSNLRLGKEIARSGGVSFIEFSPLRVTAHVTGGQRRTIELKVAKDGLTWRCTCTSKPDLFCKHLVATALQTWEESPDRIA